MNHSFNIVFPFQKIDREQRIVTGIATANNVDYEDDKISFEGSLNAFANWIGNIREMHSPLAVGKLIDYRPVPVSYRGRVYDGIEVSVYISKGAEQTWQKIIDGTLRGFSIGGRSMDAEMEFDEDLQRHVRVIKEYILGELSVVDNPCNPAGMFTMVKMMPDGSLEYSENSEDDEVLDKAIADVDLTPTESMAAAARRGLEWRQEYGRGGTSVGVARARDISNRKRLSPSTIRRMKSYFARHEVDKQASGWNSGEDGFPSAGRIAWELWGGDPGKSWANAKDAQISREEQKMAKSSEEERVFYCDKDEYAVFGDENSTCPSCAQEMKVIGFASDFDSEVINKMISTFLNKGGEKHMNLQNNLENDTMSDMDDFTDTQKDTILTKLGDFLFGNKEEAAMHAPASAAPTVTVNIDGSLLSKGIMSGDGEEVAGEESAPAEEAVAEEAAPEAEPEGGVVEDVAEESEVGDESASAENEGENEVNLEEVLAKFSSVLDDKLDTIKSEIAAEVDEKISKSVNAVEEATSETIEKLENEVEKIADTGAMKKSVDADDSDEEDSEIVEKSVESFWGGKFVPASVAKSLGYDS